MSGAAGFRWDGDANRDPIEHLHALVETARHAPSAILLSPPMFQRLELQRLLVEMKPRPSYRVRLHAAAILRAAFLRGEVKSRSFPWGRVWPPATAERALARAHALEPR